MLSTIQPAQPEHPSALPGHAKTTCLHPLPHHHRSSVRQGTHPQARRSHHREWLGMRSNSFVLSQPSLRIRAPSARSLLVSSVVRGLRLCRAIIPRLRSDEPLSSHPSCRGREAYFSFRTIVGSCRKSSFREFCSARCIKTLKLRRPRAHARARVGGVTSSPHTALGLGYPRRPAPWCDIILADAGPRVSHSYGARLSLA